MSSVSGTSGATGTGGTQGGGDPIGDANANIESFKSTMGNTEKTGSKDLAYYMELQMVMMKEQQAYSALSNIMKARSDSALTAIRNFK